MYYKIILLLFFISSLVFSQAPQGINYQAVVRDADGLLYDNQELTIIFKLIVLETGNVTWEETHVVQTNEFGLFNTIIGQGQSSGDNLFSDVNWGEGTIFVTVDIDFDNDGPQPPIDFGESQLLSVPYALYSNSSADNKWVEENNSISPINPQNKIDITSSEIDLSSDDIEIGSQNSIVQFNYQDLKFYNNQNLFIEMTSDQLNVQGRINSLEPNEPSNLTTKNYVDSRDDDVVLQMNSAFTENINYFQSEVDNILTDISNLQSNVNLNSDAYYVLQDIVNTSNGNMQNQIDIINSILSALEETIYENISLQTQLESMQNEIINLTNLISQIQETISQQ